MRSNLNHHTYVLKPPDDRRMYALPLDRFIERHFDGYHGTLRVEFMRKIAGTACRLLAGLFADLGGKRRKNAENLD
jgi:hypothetical protein